MYKRNPRFAGLFYPSNKFELLNFFNSKVRLTSNLDVRALIVPHAGYIYSGKTAFKGYSQIKDHYSKVIILAPSHVMYFKGIYLSQYNYYETPLGDVMVDNSINKIKEEYFFINENIYVEDNEHAIEVQIPYLQYFLNDFKIVPIIIGSGNDFNELTKIANAIKKIIDENTLIVVSSDFIHYGLNYGFMPFDGSLLEVKLKIKDLDYKAIDLIQNKKCREFYNFVQDNDLTICGSLPITTLCLMLDNSIKSKLIHYSQSSDLTKTKDSVSYASIIFYKK